MVTKELNHDPFTTWDKMMEKDETEEDKKAMEKLDCKVKLIFAPSDAKYIQ